MAGNVGYRKVSEQTPITCPGCGRVKRVSQAYAAFLARTGKPICCPGKAGQTLPFRRVSQGRTVLAYIQGDPTKAAILRAYKAWQVAVSAVATATEAGMDGTTINLLQNEAIALQRKLRVFQPGGHFQLKNGRAAVEGPQFPKQATWSLQVEVENSHITRIYG